MASTPEDPHELPALLAARTSHDIQDHRLSLLGEQDHARGDPHASSHEVHRRGATNFLDGLRGLAALLVFNQHYAWHFTRGAHELGYGQEGRSYHFIGLPFIRTWLAGGDAAVTVFFVLSGYVLSIEPLHKLRHSQTVGFRRSIFAASVRRPIRLYVPPLVVSFLYAILLHAPIHIALPEAWLKPQDGGVFAELVYCAKTSIEYFNPFRTHDNNQFWFPYNMVMWTLPIELKGSVLVYGVLAILSLVFTQGTDTTRPLIASGLLYGAATLMLQLAFKWSMACFLLGIYLAIVDTWKTDTAFLLTWTSRRTQTLLFHAQFFAGWYLLSQPVKKGQIQYSTETPGWVWLSKLIPPAYSPEVYYRYWQSWGAVLLIYGILRIEWLQRIFSTRALRYLGRVSFMLYLTHLLYFKVWGERVHSLFGGPLGWESDQGTFWAGTLTVPKYGPVGLDMRHLVCYAIVLPPALKVAELATAWVDLPSVKLSRMLITRLGLEKQRASILETEGSLLPR